MFSLPSIPQSNLSYTVIKFKKILGQAFCIRSCQIKAGTLIIIKAFPLL